MPSRPYRSRPLVHQPASPGRAARAVAGFLALALLAACEAPTAAPPEAPPASVSPPADAACLIEQDWLTGDYDHKVDYANPDVATDFFLLVYSHSPSFCRRMAERKRLDEVALQCRSPKRFGWVIHGLWGESEAAYLGREERRHPRFCRGDLPPLPIATIKPYLCMSPGTRLLQGQWEKHGACDFETAAAYFAKTRELFARFPLPPAELKAGAAMRWMKANSPVLRDKWLHLAGDEFGICFSRAFDVISCPRR